MNRLLKKKSTALNLQVRMNSGEKACKENGTGLGL